MPGLFFKIANGALYLRHPRLTLRYFRTLGYLPRPGVHGMVVFTYTDDLERGCRLWEQVLGFTCEIDQGVCRIYRTSPNAYVGVCMLQDRPRSTAGVTISLLTRQVDQLAARVRAAGYEIVSGPAYSEAFDVYSCIFINDDGYRCEIQRFGR